MGEGAAPERESHLEARKAVPRKPSCQLHKELKAAPERKDPYQFHNCPESS